MRKLKWYKFDQNNSGGSFITNDKVCRRVFIEAFGEREANAKAEDLGIYFDGVEAGTDCSCCGDRWYPGHVLDFPMQWSKEHTFNDVVEYANFISEHYGWGRGVQARLYYNDGTVVEIKAKG